MPPKHTTAAPIAPAPKRQRRARKAPVRFNDPAGGRGPPPSPERTPDPPELMDALAFQTSVADQMADLDRVLQDTVQRFNGVDERIDGVNGRLDALSTNIEALTLCLGGAQPLAPLPATQPLIVTSQPGMNPVLPQMQHDVLSRWPWVKRSIVEDIANGQFDIYDLPKLHRDETLRNRHIAKSVEGITLPFSGGRPQIIQARTKIQASFKDLQTVLAAWMVYTGIRLCYAPERGPGFQMFAEHLASFCLMSYDFSTALDYAIAFFQKHQNSSLEAWFEVDGYLHTAHFGNATQRAVIAAAARAASPTKTSQKTLSSFTIPIAEQVCHNYNRPTGCKFDDDCLRLHVCSLCRGEHTQLVCPQAPKESISQWRD